MDLFLSAVSPIAQVRKFNNAALYKWKEYFRFSGQSEKITGYVTISPGIISNQWSYVFKEKFEKLPITNISITWK
jgi:hypothetical protein